MAEVNRDKDAEKKLAQEIKKLEDAAKGGNVSAQVVLAKRLYAGNGVKQDYKKAANWFEKAAAQGSAEAQSNLGYCYYSGLGVKRDYDKAVYWYTKSAELGNAAAQNYLEIGRAHV